MKKQSTSKIVKALAVSGLIFISQGVQALESEVVNVTGSVTAVSSLAPPVVTFLSTTKGTALKTGESLGRLVIQSGDDNTVTYIVSGTDSGLGTPGVYKYTHESMPEKIIPATITPSDETVGISKDESGDTILAAAAETLKSGTTTVVDLRYPATPATIAPGRYNLTLNIKASTD